MTLPFHPWWHHPGHRYEGRHRGTYQHRDPATMIHTETRIMRIWPYWDLITMRREP